MHVSVPSRLSSNLFFTTVSVVTHVITFTLCNIYTVHNNMCAATHDEKRGTVKSPCTPSVDERRRHRGWFPPLQPQLQPQPPLHNASDVDSDDFDEKASSNAEPTQQTVSIRILLDMASRAMLLDRLPTKHGVIEAGHVAMFDQDDQCLPSEAMLAPLGVPLAITVTHVIADGHAQIALVDPPIPKWLTRGRVVDYLVLSTVPGVFCVFLACTLVYLVFFWACILVCNRALASCVYSVCCVSSHIHCASSHVVLPAQGVSAAHQHASQRTLAGVQAALTD